jgi:hypothetical protein
VTFDDGRSDRAEDVGREVELFEPIRRHLEECGYVVRAEVEHCDIVAYNQGRLVVVELKRRFGVDVLMQAVARQRITSEVYLGLPHAALRTRRRQRRAARLLRRLELGLLLVDLRRTTAVVQTLLEPTPYQRRVSRTLRARVLEEMIGRSGGQNRGGVTGTKLMTAYRENALQIACCLARQGPLSTRRLRDLGCGTKASVILQRDVYGWFRRVSRGVYDITAAGLRAIEEHPAIASHYLDAAAADEETPPSGEPGPEVQHPGPSG